MRQRRGIMRPFYVKILKATDLPISDYDNDLSDPYVAISILQASQGL
jgi:hypothetical protein